MSSRKVCSIEPGCGIGQNAVMHRAGHLAVLLLAVLAVFAQTAMAVGTSEDSAAQSGTSGNIHWDITDGRLTLEHDGDPNPEPMAWSGTEKSPWYIYRDSYTSCIIDPLFTTLCDNQFLDSTYLSSVTIPEDVDHIGQKVFMNCRSLISITIPAKVAGIGDMAFADCQNLRQITFLATTWGIALSGDHTFDLLMHFTSSSMESEVFSPGNIADGKLDGHKSTNTSFKYLDNRSFTVKITVNDPQWGYVTSTSISVSAGTSITSNGDTLNVGGSPSVAVPSPQTAQYSYRFDHWAGIPSGKEVIKDVTVTACFERTVNTYSLSFVVDNPGYGSVGRSSITNVPYGSEITVEDNKVTVISEYVFAYPRDASLVYTYYFSSWSGIPADKTVVGNLTITACFDKKANSYTVVFDSAGGSQVASQTVGYGHKAKEPDKPTKGESLFDGWFFDSNLWNFDTPVTRDITLVAHWHDEYIVTFDVQGHGDAPKSETLNKGDKVEKPPNPQEQGFLFGGWYKESSCTTAWNFDTDTVQAPMTLYAKWTPAECFIIKGTHRIDCSTLEYGIAACSDGDTIVLLYSKVHDSITFSKSVTVVFNGHVFYSETSAITIGAKVTFEGMYQMPLTMTFTDGSCLTTDLEFDLTAKFVNPQFQAGDVFVRGLETDDIAVAHQGYAATERSDAIMLAKVTDLPFAVFDGNVFVFYSNPQSALTAHPEQTCLYFLNYVPLYGGTSTLSYSIELHLDRDITLATVTRVTDGTHSSFYLGTEEVYNNGQSIALPAGKDLITKIGGTIFVAAGNVLKIGDVSVSQTIVLGGGLTPEQPLATVHLLRNAPAARLIIGFTNLDNWVDKIETPEGWVYRLKPGCNYEFITSEHLSLDNLISVDASGFKADIGLNGSSARLAASSSMVAYIRTSDTAFTGYTSIEEAIAQAVDPNGKSVDRTVYILYRTPQKQGDQPTVSHNIDVNIVMDGSFRLDTVHQNVDQSGKVSTYTVDDRIATLILAEGRCITVTQDVDMSKIYVRGVIRIEGSCTVDLGGSWDSDQTITMDLSAHEAGTVVKNAGSVLWNATAYPESGCSVWKVRQDLVLSVPIPETKDYSVFIWSIVGICLQALAVTGVYVVRQLRK